jgi:hypothetical protein
MTTTNKMTNSYNSLTITPSRPPLNHWVEGSIPSGVTVHKMLFDRALDWFQRPIFLENRQLFWASLSFFW